MQVVLVQRRGGWDEGVLRRQSSLSRVAVVVFFFQAEDGIRDVAVTGVQTCALPISGTRSLQHFLRGHLPLAHELSLTDSLLPHIVASINHGVASLDVREPLTSPPRHEVIVQLGTLFHKFVICIWPMELLERRLWCGPLLRPRR